MGVEGLSFRRQRLRQMQQLARGGTPRHFHWLTRRPSPSIEGADHRVAAPCGERGEVGHRAQSPLAAVADLRRTPDARAWLVRHRR